MFTVRIEDTFAAAHFLPYFHGKCENLHGHNYRVRVHVKGDQLDKGGMLLDFGVLKSALKDVLAGLDHSHLNENEYFLEKSPSAENIALYIYTSLKKLLPNADIYQVEVFETEKNVAAYMPD